MGSRGTSRPSFAKNTKGARLLYRERIHYKNKILTKRSNRNIINLWEGSRSKFGKVDLQNRPIRLNPAYLKEVKSKSDKNTRFFLINFVADAFNDFREYMRGANEGSTGANAFPLDSRFTNFDIYNSNIWIGIDSVYKEHMQTQFTPFVVHYLQIPDNRKRVRNIENFIDMWFKLCTQIGRTTPLTKTGYFESNLAPPNLNGHMAEIVRRPKHDDDIYKDGWITDPGFEYYSRGAAMHGFLVDKNAPWRLVANFESRKMAGYMAKYDIGSMAHLFDTYFVKAYLDDIRELKEILYSFYSFYVRVDPSYETYRWCGHSSKLIQGSVYRKQSSREAFFKRYGDKYWMRIWFLMRLSELAVVPSIGERGINDLLSTAYKIEKTLDLSSAMGYLNNNLLKLSGLGGPPTRAFVDRQTDKQVIIKT